MAKKAEGRRELSRLAESLAEGHHLSSLFSPLLPSLRELFDVEANRWTFRSTGLEYEKGRALQRRFRGLLLARKASGRTRSRRTTCSSCL